MSPPSFKRLPNVYIYIYTYAVPFLFLSSCVLLCPQSVPRKGKGLSVDCAPCILYSLVVIAVKRVHSSRKGSDLLGLDFLLATTDAAEALLERIANAAAGGIAASNAGTFGIGCFIRDAVGSIVVVESPAATRPHLGASIANGFVILQGSLDGERWLALAFEIVWVVFLYPINMCSRQLALEVSYLSGPTPVVCSWLTLQIGSLLIIENSTEAVGHTRWDVGNAFQRAMFRDGVVDVLARRSPQCLLVGFADRIDGCILDMLVASNACSVVWAFVVVASGADCIESIDHVRALEVLLPKMRRPVSNFLIFSESIKWPVRHVAWVSLSKRAAA